MKITYDVQIPHKIDSARQLSDESKALDGFMAGVHQTMCLEYDDVRTMRLAYANIYNRNIRHSYNTRVTMCGLCIYLEKLS